MKYVDKGGRLRSLITDKQSLNGVENYFTNSLLYRDSLEANPQSEEQDSGIEMDTESESEDECTQELDYSVLGVNKSYVINTADIDGKWYINEDRELACLSRCLSKFVPSDTNIDDDDVIGTEVGGNVWLAMDALTYCKYQ